MAQGESRTSYGSTGEVTAAVAGTCSKSPNPMRLTTSKPNPTINAEDDSTVSSLRAADELGWNSDFRNNSSRANRVAGGV